MTVIALFAMVLALALSVWEWFEADRVHMRLYEVDPGLAQTARNPLVTIRDDGTGNSLARLIANELPRHPDARVRYLVGRVRRIRTASRLSTALALLALVVFLSPAMQV